MNFDSVLYILLLFAAFGFATYQYAHHRKSKNAIAKFASPLYLMLTIVSLCVAIFSVLLILGIVK
jgi:hypothetical protein